MYVPRVHTIQNGLITNSAVYLGLTYVPVPGQSRFDAAVPAGLASCTGLIFVSKFKGNNYYVTTYRLNLFYFLSIYIYLCISCLILWFPGLSVQKYGRRYLPHTFA